MKPRRDKGRISGPFVPMLKDTMKQPAWIALSHGARSLYVAIKSRYNSKLGNAVYLSARVGAKELGSNKDYITRWFRELEYYGFIALIMPGHLGVDGRGKAPHWRLTEEWFAGEPPTRDYQRWTGEKFHEQKSPKYYLRKKQNPVPQTGDTVSPKLGTVASLKLGTPPRPIVPQTGDIQPQSPVPQTGDITSSTTPRAEKRARVQSSNGRGSAAARPAPVGDLQIPDDLSIPWFMRREPSE